MFIKSFCKSQFPHTSVNLFFILVKLKGGRGEEGGTTVAVVEPMLAFLAEPASQGAAGSERERDGERERASEMEREREREMEREREADGTAIHS